MAREPTVTKLSKSILDMKFMKKTKEKVQKELEDAEGREMYSHEITDEMKKSGMKCFVYESSYMPFEDLLVGRLSFRGMNPEIERLMELEMEEADRLSGKSKEMDVTDAEMAAHYNPLVNTMDKKFNKKKFRSEIQEKQNNSEEQTNDEGNSNKNFGKKKKNKFGYGAPGRFLGDQGSSDSPPTQRRDKKFKRNFDESCDSPSVQHRDKKRKFMKPADY